MKLYKVQCDSKYKSGETIRCEVAVIASSKKAAGSKVKTRYSKQGISIKINEVNLVYPDMFLTDAYKVQR